jgi:ADP-ribose pyrophosphatase
MDFNLLNSEKRYQGRAFDVRRDQLRAPDGQTLSLDIVEHVGAVTLVPLDEQGRIWFVRQYRHAAGRVLLELPAGTLEAGEDPQVCAHREIREEIGQAAGKVEKLGEFFLAPGYSTEYMHVFMATQLKPDPLPGDEDEFLSVSVIPLAQVMDLVRSGELSDAKSLAALLLASRRLGLATLG